MNTRLCLNVLICLFVTVFGEVPTDADAEVAGRDKKVLSIFQVVKFSNTACVGDDTRNGTCYTSAECENVGGSSQGTCADGFGVCCVVTITSGGSSSQNNTYITLDSTITAGSHQYEICPCSDNICRIKFDFTSFQLASPNTGAGQQTVNGITAIETGDVGMCLTDTFSITSTCGRGTPIICGANTNQHMFLDTCGTECLTVNVGIGSETPSETRAFTIEVMQYACGDENGGPRDCLQYYQNTSGKIRSFNFPDASPGTAIPGNYAFHLHKQSYKICMRRGLGNEIICYTPCTNVAGTTITGANMTPTAQPSFGLSASDDAEKGMGLVDTDCSTDYIWFRPGTEISTQFTSAINAQDTLVEDTTPIRMCGRYFTTTVGGAEHIDLSVCSYGVPFTVGVEFDDSDLCTTKNSLKTCESEVSDIAAEAAASGNLGFSLCYIQQANT